jgi:hypothetical protein
VARAAPKLPGFAYRAWILAKRYLEEKSREQGRERRCLTYKGLRSWLHYALPRQEIYFFRINFLKPKKKLR